MVEPGCEGTALIAARGRILSGLAGVLTSGPGPTLSRFSRDARGATAIEYALVAGLIFLVIAGSLRTYGSRVASVYDKIGTTVTQNN